MTSTEMPFLAACRARKHKKDRPREKFGVFKAVRKCFWPEFSTVSGNVAKWRTQKRHVFKKTARARARETVTFLTLCVCVFRPKLTRNDTHKKGFLAASPPKMIKDRPRVRAEGACEKIWRF